jgi:hypothetical protein
MFGSFFWPPGGLFAGTLPFRRAAASTGSANIDMLSHHGATGPLQSLVDGCFSETVFQL